MTDQRDRMLLPGLVEQLPQGLAAHSLLLQELVEDTNYYTNLDGGLVKLFRASTRDCQRYACKPTCAPKSPKQQIMRTAYDAYYRHALAQQQRQLGQYRRRLRQSIVKPVFGISRQH